jgi:predicted MPP superfamily phosphohydrolase
VPHDEVSAATAARRGLGAVGALAGLGAAGLGYAWWEARWFTLRHVEMPVLPPGAPDLRVLHLTDVHLTPSQGRKRAWLSSLAGLRPDLVVNTGDNLAHRAAIGPLVEELGELLEVPGVFVLGSNDYFEPTLRNPVRYLLPDDGKRHVNTRQLPWRELKRRFAEAGWLDLTNTRGSLEVRGVRLALAGVDDPHLGYDDLAAVAGPAEPAADVRLGVAHAPYLRVLDQYAADGYDAILAGHTHGGQLCLPFNRALVTNCDLDRARASGLSRHGRAWLHVSAGAGTSPYVPVRFCCRPSATLLRLVPRDR